MIIIQIQHYALIVLSYSRYQQWICTLFLGMHTILIFHYYSLLASTKCHSYNYNAALSSRFSLFAHTETRVVPNKLTKLKVLQERVVGCYITTLDAVRFFIEVGKTNEVVLLVMRIIRKTCVVNIQGFPHAIAVRME